MKTSLSLVQLAQQIETESNSKRDLVADTGAMQFDQQMSILRVGDGTDTFTVSDHAHQQIATRLKIPTRFYDRMRTDYPAQLSDTVNTILHNEPERRMVRTLGNHARAFLSDRYKRIDHDLIAEATLSALSTVSTQIEPASFAITDKRLYMKILFPKIEGEVRKGDLVQAGFVVSNSEIGMGSAVIQPLIYRLVCTNGMTMPISGLGSMKKRHLGARIIDCPDFVIRSNDSIQADRLQISYQIRDIIQALADGSAFERILSTMQQSANGPMASKPLEAVQTLAKQFALSDNEQESMLSNLIRNGDLSQWGFLNAVTEIANNHESYDRATELESIGGQILTLSPKQWETVAA
jgi:hypothetical protein